jgi:HEPN domain-containing protein
MTKNDHIEFWTQLAKEDWDYALFAKQAGRNIPSLFFFHLSIEKLLKALWVKANISDTPPFTHDLKKIAGETEIVFSAEMLDELSIVNDWNIEARYPDFKRRLYNTANADYMNHHFPKLNALYQCIQEELLKK